MYTIRSLERLPDGSYAIILTDENGYSETGTGKYQAHAFEDAKKKLQEANK